MLVVRFLWLTISIQTAQQKFQDYNALIVQKFAEKNTYRFLTFILKVSMCIYCLLGKEEELLNHAILIYLVGCFLLICCFLLVSLELLQINELLMWFMSFKISVIW